MTDTMNSLNFLPPDPILERRAEIQRLSAQSLRRRQSFSRGFEFAMALALTIALIPLVSILYSLVSKGWRYLSWPFITVSRPRATRVLSSIGGIWNAVIGTIVIVGLAAIVAIPVGITIAVYLSESNGRVANALRAAVEIMTGMPSILLGVFGRRNNRHENEPSVLGYCRLLRAFDFDRAGYCEILRACTARCAPDAARGGSGTRCAFLESDAWHHFARRTTGHHHGDFVVVGPGDG